MKTLLAITLVLIIFSSCKHYRCDTYSGAKKSSKYHKPRELAFQSWR
jgi:hypothetical protein